MVISEHAEQAALINWSEIMSNKVPELDLLFAIPNGGQRHPAVAVKLKAEGVKPGIPDLFLPVARYGFHGLFIEMKREKGGTVSKIQKQKIMELQAQGYMVAVCKGFEHAKSVLEDYFKINARASNQELVKR